MHSITTLLLICAAHVPPAECQPDTALDLIIGPEIVTTGQCGLHSQAYLASSAIAEVLTSETYLKIQCSRQHAIAKAVRTEPPPRPPIIVDIQR